VEIAVGGWILWPQVGVTTGCDESASRAGARPEERGPAAGCGTHIARAVFATGLIHFVDGEIPGKDFGQDMIVPGRAAAILNPLALVYARPTTTASSMSAADLRSLDRARFTESRFRYMGYNDRQGFPCSVLVGARMNVSKQQARIRPLISSDRTHEHERLPSVIRSKALAVNVRSSGVNSAMQLLRS